MTAQQLRIASISATNGFLIVKISAKIRDIDIFRRCHYICKKLIIRK